MKVKGKLSTVLIMILMTSSICTTATTMPGNNQDTAIMGNHITHIYGPWGGHENYNYSTGNVVTNSDSTTGTGYAQGICDVWITGGGEGDGHYMHWIEYECPVTNLDGTINISYKYSASAELDCLLGGTAYAKIWLTFSVDNEVNEVVLYEKEVATNGHDEYDAWNVVETWSKSLTLTKKTYKIGVKASFELSMNMLVGTHSYCSAVIFGTWNPNDLIIAITWPNQSPEKPQIISGERNGSTGHQYQYTAIGTDIEEDNLYYMFDWGDGSPTQWSIYYAKSGEEMSDYHIFSKEGTYNIKVKTKDTYGAESKWSDPYSVTMPLDMLDSLQTSPLPQIQPSNKPSGRQVKLQFIQLLKTIMEQNSKKNTIT